MNLFTVIQTGTEFSVRAILNKDLLTVSYTGEIDGKVFTKGKDYDIIRDRVIAAIKLHRNGVNNVRPLQ